MTKQLVISVVITVECEDTFNVNDLSIKEIQAANAGVNIVDWSTQNVEDLTLS